jgi:hypothetical protein
VSITVTIHAEDGLHLRRQLLELLGPGTSGIRAEVFEGARAGFAAAPQIVDPSPAVNAEAARQVVDTATAGDVQHPTAGPVTPGREPGKPGPGRQRRTKAEIDEDERYPNGFQAGGTQAAQANISSGAEDRVNPDDQEQGAEDTEDEEADGVGDMDPDDQGTAAEPVRTKDDLRKIVGQFGKLFQNDMLGVELAVQPAFKAAGVENISSCPDDKLGLVFNGMIAIGKRLEENPGEIAEISAKAKAAAGALG